MNGKVYPIQAIVFFVVSEGYNVTVAITVSALTDDQCVSLKVEASLNSATEISYGVSSVTVEHYLKGCSGSVFVISAYEGEPIS